MLLALTACSVRLTEEQTARIEAFLGPSEILEVERAQPRRRAPFLERSADAQLAVRHDFPTPKSEKAMQMLSFFDQSGRFLGAQSLRQIEDPRRRTVESAEEVMQQTGEIVVGRPSVPIGVDLQAIWQAVGQRVDLAQIEEFEISYVQYRFHDGSERPALIINIWGPENPLGMPDSLPEVLKNRIRLIYDIENQRYHADNVL